MNQAFVCCGSFQRSTANSLWGIKAFAYQTAGTEAFAKRDGRKKSGSWYTKKQKNIFTVHSE